MAETVKKEKKIEEKINRTMSTERKELTDDIPDKKIWDLNGSILEVLEKNAHYLSEEQIDQVFGGLMDGLSDEQIKKYITKPLQDMKIYRYMLVLANKRNEV